MKTQITISNNHPAFLQCEMMMNEFAQAMAALKTEAEARDLAGKLLEGSDFFWGCGNHHLWVHHKLNSLERVFIAYF